MSEPTPAASPFLIVEEVAVIGRTTDHTVRHWFSVGKLKGHRAGKRVLFRARDVADFFGVPVEEILSARAAAAAFVRESAVARAAVAA